MVTRITFNDIVQWISGENFMSECIKWTDINVKNLNEKFVFEINNEKHS